MFTSFCEYLIIINPVDAGNTCLLNVQILINPMWNEINAGYPIVCSHLNVRIYMDYTSFHELSIITHFI